MNVTLDPSNVRDYETFLRVKQLPLYRITGRPAWFPDEYAAACVNLERAVTQSKHTDRLLFSMAGE